MKLKPDPGFGLIYLITLLDMKHYVGKTDIPLKERMAMHERDAVKMDSPLYIAWRELGGISSIEVLGTFRKGKELKDAETMFIEQYDSVRNGYNGNKGGGGRPSIHGSGAGRQEAYRDRKGLKNMTVQISPEVLGSVNAFRVKNKLTQSEAVELLLSKMFDMIGEMAL